MKTKVAALAASLLVSAFLASEADAVVLRVVVVQTENVDAYVKEVERGQALLKRLGSSGVVRIWRARFAGEEAGQVVVSVEYPDFVAYANDDKKLSAEPDYQNWMKGLAKIRKIVSDSLYEELKSPPST